MQVIARVRQWLELEVEATVKPAWSSSDLMIAVELVQPVHIVLEQTRLLTQNRRTLFYSSLPLRRPYKKLF
jgi:GAF domain-containing protein